MLTKNDLDQIRTVIKGEITPVKNDIKSLDKKLDTVQEDISEILTALDQHQAHLEIRVEKLEEEVGITSN